ncbi:MAG: hypothetical protein HGA45_31415 [Chloroflexales bacterium]|nr:hypothetical protein [Chloroflexales bacterium]
MPAEGGITVVSRIPNSMELWWVGPNGSIQDAFWYEGWAWSRFELAPAGSASATEGLGAVSRKEKAMGAEAPPRIGQTLIWLGIVLLVAALTTLSLAIHAPASGPALRTSPHPAVALVGQPTSAPPVVRPASEAVAPALDQAPEPPREGQP